MCRKDVSLTSNDGLSTDTRLTKNFLGAMPKRNLIDLKDDFVGHSLREEGKSISDVDYKSAGVLNDSAMSEKTIRL